MRKIAGRPLARMLLFPYHEAFVRRATGTPRQPGNEALQFSQPPDMASGGFFCPGGQPSHRIYPENQRNSKYRRGISIAPAPPDRTRTGQPEKRKGRTV